MPMRIKDRAALAGLLRQHSVSQSELARRIERSRSFVNEVVSGAKCINETDAGLIAAILSVEVGDVFVTEVAPSRRAAIERISGNLTTRRSA